MKMFMFYALLRQIYSSTWDHPIFFVKESCKPYRLDISSKSRGLLLFVE